MRVNIYMDLGLMKLYSIRNCLYHFIFSIGQQGPCRRWAENFHLWLKPSNCLDDCARTQTVRKSGVPLVIAIYNEYCRGTNWVGMFLRHLSMTHGSQLLIETVISFLSFCHWEPAGTESIKPTLMWKSQTPQAHYYLHLSLQGSSHLPMRRKQILLYSSFGIGMSYFRMMKYICGSTEQFNSVVK